MKFRFFRTFLIVFVFLWFGTMVVLPNLLVLILSFLSKDTKNFVSLPFTLNNYKHLLDPYVYKIVLQSLYLAAIATIICLILGLPFAYILSRFPKKWRDFLLVLIVIPFWTNSLVRTYALISILSQNGVLSRLLLSLGIIGKPMQILYTNSAVLIGFCYTLIPYMILPLYSSLEKIENNLIEAARDLGASGIQIFFRIIIPLTVPGILAGSILVFLPALGMFYVAETLGGVNTFIIGGLIKNEFMVARNWPVGSAISTILTLLMILLMVVYRYSNRKDKSYFKKAAPIIA